MHHKKRSNKNFTPSRKYNINHYQVNRLERLEKNIFFLFTLAIITSVIFLYAYSPITGNMVLQSNLDKSNYGANEKITGNISLQMQEGDILPGDSKISIFIMGNSTKCQTKYLCSEVGEVEWYKINSTSGECYLKNADPDKICCQQNALNCNQIILNSGFENGLNNWVFTKIGNPYPYAIQDNLTIFDEDTGELIYNSKVAKISTTDITSDGSAVLTQTFATPVVIGGLISNQPNLIISDIKYYQDNFNLVYNITICNTGYGKTTIPFYVRTNIKKENNLIGSPMYQIKQNLTTGQCISNISRSYKESGNYTLIVMVDANLTSRPFGYINETNESDNTKQISINNYYVRELYFGTNNRVIYNNLTNSINYTVEICNDYNTSLGPFNVSVYSPTSSTNVTSEPNLQTAPNFYIQFNAIAPKTCNTHSAIYSLNTDMATISFAQFPTRPPLANGTYYYWIWIDKENKINDRVEDNKIQESFRVGEGRPGHEKEVEFSDFEQEEKEENVLLFDSTPGFSSTNNFSLGWIAYADIIYPAGCAFEIIINSSSGRRLHYYYVISDICSVPADTALDKYLTQTYDINTGLIDVYTNLYQNWIAAYPNGVLDKLTGISLVSHGKKIGDDVYAQDAYLDNIRLDKTSNLQTTRERSCESKNKICCLEGAGSGVYYGEQLSCSEGYGCWEKCAQKELTLSQFIQQSSTSTKNNKTEGDCQVQIDSGIVDLVDYCGEYSGCTNCVGEGYTACLDVSSTSPKASCKNWNNQYVLNISKLNLSAPSSNGTYSVKLSFSYKTKITSGSLGETINISTFEIPLIVGAGEPPVVPTCLDSQYVNCTGTWSQCDAYNTKTRNATCYYSGIQACPNTKYFAQTEQCYIQSNVTTCTEYDWQCGGWSTCEGGNQIRTCNLVSTSCDATISGSYVPEQQQACEIQDEEGFDTKYLIYGGIGLILLVGVFLLIKFLISHESEKESTYQSSESLMINKEKEKTEKTEKKEDYPELASYIKDALAAGMNPSEIRLKLQEAGWPKNIIDSVFKKFE